MVEEKHPGAVLEEAIRLADLSIRGFAAQIGVTHPCVIDWCKGRRVPNDLNQVTIEAFFATRKGGKVVRRPDGTIESAVPRALWAPPAKAAA